MQEGQEPGGKTRGASLQRQAASKRPANRDRGVPAQHGEAASGTHEPAALPTGQNTPLSDSVGTASNGSIAGRITE